MTQLPIETSVPLYVDLDGTLTKTDTLWEGVWRIVSRHPSMLFTLLTWLPAGRAIFKRRVSLHAPFDAAHLPYHPELLALLHEESAAGRPLHLATASDEAIARRVAEHLNLFDTVIASDADVNRKGDAKVAAILRQSTRFLYAGDSNADLPIWRASAGAIIVGTKPSLRSALQAAAVPILHVLPTGSKWRFVARAIRVHQWAKNALVFLPVFLGHQTRNLATWQHAALMSVAFCAAASCAYVLNDLLDLDADRQHARKRTRPFAAGDLSIPTGLALFVLFLLAASALCWVLPPSAAAWLAVYIVSTQLYSLYLKTQLLADVIGLAFLYILRVVAGGAATGIVISPWTLAFCLFFFYSLALIKRFGELQSLAENRTGLHRRGYLKIDAPIIAAIGISSAILSVVVFALFITSPDVKANYLSPSWLWLACPVILYWFGRLWVLANRGIIAEDPLFFSLRDPFSWCAALCIGLVWLVASTAH